MGSLFFFFFKVFFRVYVGAGHLHALKTKCGRKMQLPVFKAKPQPSLKKEVAMEREDVP